MKRQDNSFMKSRLTFFVGFAKSFVMPAMWPNPDAVDVVGCQAMENFTIAEMLMMLNRWVIKGEKLRVYINQPLAEITREFMTAAAGFLGWKLASYNHESRTARYVYGEDNHGDVTFSMAGNWLKVDDAEKAWNSYRKADKWYSSRFGFGLLGSPGMTGGYAVEHSLPQKVDASLPCADFLAHLYAHTTQGRSETFLPADVRDFYYYDRTFAYAADCYLDMPCGNPRFEKGGDFVPYKCAFYNVRFKVPENWEHVGLLPVLIPGDGWQWPSEGHHETFVAEPELRVAIGCGWPVEVVSAWRFDTGRPLELWRNKLVSLWQNAKAEGDKAEADIYRMILLHGLGVMYARSFKRERIIDRADFVNLNETEALSAEFLESGGVSVEGRYERDERFRMPHWTAYTWARARARLVSTMLKMRPSEIIGCHVDALYTTAELRGEEMAGKVGQFRLKGRLSYADAVQVRSAKGLLALRQASEGGEQ